MRRSSSWIVGLAVLFVGLGAAHAAQPTFSGSADVLVVEVPVQVLKDGEPVRGLTAADFEVYAGKDRLPVTGFEMLDLEAPAPPPSDKGWKQAQPVTARRHFLLLFDLAFSSPKALAKGEEAARDLIDRLHPSDLVAVAAYSPARGPELLLGFTTDRRQARAALDALGKPEMVARTGDPLRLVLATGNPFGSESGGGAGPGRGGGGGNGGPGGNGPGAEARQEAVAKAMANSGFPPFLASTQDLADRADRNGREKAVTAMAHAFQELAKTVGTLYGRKYVVFFSEGFDASVFSGTADLDVQNRQAMISSKGAVWGIDSELRFGNTKAASDLEAMLEEFRRADCVVQAVDTGGLREGVDPGSPWAGGRDSLFLLADSTGGDFYENYNDLSDAMDKMLRRTSVTYVLAVQPPDLPHDGAYHTIRVELKGASRGTRVVHRPGFYAPRPAGQASATEKILQTARGLVAGEESNAIRTSVLAAPFPGSVQGASWVPVLVEVDGSSLLAGVEGWSVPVEIYGYAFDAQGQARDYFSQNLGLDLLKTGAVLKQGGLKFFGHLNLPPGDWSVRVLVRNAATGASGLRTVAVHVPELGSGSLLPAFFPEPPGRWLMVREARPEEGVAYPFLSGGAPYIPASLPRLAPGQEAAVSLVAYHLPPGEVQAEARLRTSEGRDAGVGRLRVLGREAGTDGAERLKATFEPPAGLAPGEYTLLVTLTDGAGGARSSATAISVGEAPHGGSTR
ncbi:MAG TPA: VWA domain-containing protein [Thermoanaerobaculia bacterium]|jgi:VWFA-related protein|nr:VWA domain-containing protein [Thermoanaerobaculia bacterium]